MELLLKRRREGKIREFSYFYQVTARGQLAPVVQTMDSAIHRINHYPADKHKQNQLSYPVCYMKFFFTAFSEFREGEIKSMASSNVVCVTRFLEYCHLS